MNFKRFLSLLGDLIQLKESSMRALLADKTVTPWALASVVVGTIGSSLSVVVFPVHEGFVVYRPDFIFILLHILLHSLVAFAALYGGAYLLVHGLKVQVTMEGFVRVVGMSSVLGVLGLFPLLGFLAGLWQLVIGVFFLHKVLKMDWEKLLLFVVLMALGIGLLQLLLS